MAVVGNGKVFISHAHADDARCQPLLRALDGWHVDYWFDVQTMAAGDDLTDSIQQAILSHDIFLRVCTSDLQQSYWCKLEQNAFRGILADDHKHHGSGKRVLINLILDRGYKPEPFDYDTIFIDGAHGKQNEWLGELRRALERHGAIPKPPAPPPDSAPAVEVVSQPTLAHSAPVTTAAPVGASAVQQNTTGKVSRASRRTRNTLIASLATLLVVLSFSALALANRNTLFGVSSSSTRTPSGHPSPTTTPYPTTTPVPLITHTNATMRYKVTLPADLTTHTYYAPPYSWEEIMNAPQYGQYLHGSQWAEFSIDEASQFNGWSARDIANYYVSSYVQGNSGATHSAITPLHQTTDGDCASATINNPKNQFWPQEVIGCTYNGRGYYILLKDYPTDFNDDLKTFFTPILSTLTFY